MAKLTNEDVKKVATLAQLPLTREEISTLKPQLSEIIEYVEQLNEVNTENIDPTSQTTRLINVFREDVVDPTRVLNSEEALSNTHDKHNNYFVVDLILKNKNE